MTDTEIAGLVRRLCLPDDLSSHDPYDVWKTSLGIAVKDLYNRNRYVGLPPAALLTLADHLFNRFLRRFYAKQEFPIVRALAAQSLINVAGATGDEHCRAGAKRHIDWLLSNRCHGYSGYGWGLGFTWPAGKSLVYDANTPFTTHTPYALEAIHRYIELTGDRSYFPAIRRIYEFYEKDVKVLHDTDDSMAVSYGPMADRVVNNAVSYALYAYGIFSLYLEDERERIHTKIQRLYAFLRNAQRNDGSWLYEPFGNRSFIDCFHSCFVIKNLFKANRISPLIDCDSVIRRGYRYVRDGFYDEKKGLVVRFSKKNKPSIVKYDLYDNAEFMGLAYLLGDTAMAERMQDAIRRNFVSGEDIYSVIDVLGVRRNRNCLRWAVMPYVHALSGKLGR